MELGWDFYHGEWMWTRGNKFVTLELVMNSLLMTVFVYPLVCRLKREF